ncbi:unnamed protein product [Microthlaspi erraticum]|uniref:Uncharacterized protein n=1 Tax=Microthlaspi erraticum TaxID=1685480 RepID=A0A6D2K3N2_9BRAS|nr:unnamed protein product [Microthlaspi erraticum]
MHPWSLLASHNGCLRTHSNHVSEPRAKLIYKLSTGVELILMQALSLLDDDVLIRPLHYQKDKRSGKEYIKREDEKKKKMKQDNLLHLRSIYISAHRATSEASFTVDLGSVRFPLLRQPQRDSGLGHRLHSPDLHGDGSGTSRQPPRHKAKKGEIEDATGLTQIVNQSGSASGRMDGHVAELSGA